MAQRAGGDPHQQTQQPPQAAPSPADTRHLFVVRWYLNVDAQEAAATAAALEGELQEVDGDISCSVTADGNGLGVLDVDGVEGKNLKKPQLETVDILTREFFPGAKPAKFSDMGESRALKELGVVVCVFVCLCAPPSPHDSI